MEKILDKLLKMLDDGEIIPIGVFSEIVEYSLHNYIEDPQYSRELKNLMIYFNDHFNELVSEHESAKKLNKMMHPNLDFSNHNSGMFTYTKVITKPLSEELNDD